MATQKNWLAEVQQDAQKKREGGGGGFFENLGGLADMVKELPGGLVNFAGQVDDGLTNLLGGITAIPKGIADKIGLPEPVGEVWSGLTAMTIPGGAAAKAAIDLKRRDEGGLSGIQDRMLTNDPNLSLMQNIDAKLNREVPALVAFPKGVAETGKTTAQNVSAVATGNAGDAPYAKAWSEGELFPLLINDIGNLAAVGELGGGMLTRASQSATRAETAAQVAAGDFSRLPAPPPAATMAAAAETASPTLTMTTPVMRAAARTSRVGERLAPYAPQLRAVEDVVGSGTDIANKIAGAPIYGPLAAGKGLLNIVEANIPQVANAAEMARTGIKNYGLARATQGGVQAESSAATHPFANEVVDSVDWINKNLSDAEKEAVIAARAGWANPEMLTQRQSMAAAAGKGVEVPEWGPKPEVWDVLQRWDDARNAAEPTADQRVLLDRMDEATARAERAQSVQDDRLATGYGRKSPGDPDTLAKEAFGNEPVEPWVQARLDRDQQYQAARKIVGDFEANPPEPIPVPEAQPAAGNLPPLYHGASRPLPGDTPYVGYGAGSGNLLGGDFYASSSEDVAKSYLTKGKGGEPSLYEVKWAGEAEPRIFDADAPMPPEVAARAKAAYDAHWAWSGEFVGDNPFDQIIENGGSFADAMREFKSQLADEGITRTAADEAVQGFLDGTFGGEVDALRYQGGVRAGNGEQLHDAYSFLEGDKLRVAPRPLEPQAPPKPAGVANAEAKIAERERWAREHPMSAPADWRDAMQNARAGQKAAYSVADELEAIDPELAAQLRETADAMPVTIDQMLDAGWERPGHVYAGEFDAGPSGPPGPARSPRLSKTSGEFTRDSGPAKNFTTGRFFGEMLRNHHLQNVNEIIRQGYQQFAEQRPAVLDDVLDQTNSAEGVVKEMRRRGYEAVDAQTLAKQTADNVDLAEGGTIWVPKGVFDGFEAARNDVTGTPYQTLRAFDKAQGVWKAAVLPLNPRWLVGNVGGNAILAGSTLGARDILNPENWRRALEAVRNPDEHVSRLLKRGAAESDLGSVVGEETVAKGGKVRRAGRKVIQKSYEYNGVVDDFARTFIYTAKKAEGEQFLANLRRLKDEGAITADRYEALAKMPDKIRGGGPKAWTDEAAIQQALNYAGDFTNLSRFERNVVRRVMPFYAWNRHITQLAFRLPLENPYRVAWTLKLADMYNDDENAPDWLKGAINLGGGNFLRSSLNPYGGTVGAENPFFNPAQMLASTTPFIQWPLAMANISGRGPIKGPDYKPGWIGAESALGYLTNQTPITRVAADVLQGPYARGMDRSPVMSRGRPIENEMLGGRWAPVGNYLTGFSVAQIDPAEEARKAAKKKRNELRKSRQ